MSERQKDSFEELIYDILKTEKNVLRCLNRYLCKILREIERDEYLDDLEKIKILEDLMYAAAEKQRTSAEFLNSLPKLSNQEFEFALCTWIQPGESIPLSNQSEDLIKRIKFSVKSMHDGKVSLTLNDKKLVSVKTCEITNIVTWFLPEPKIVEGLKLRNVGIVPVCIYDMKIK